MVCSLNSEHSPYPASSLDENTASYYNVLLVYSTIISYHVSAESVMLVNTENVTVTLEAAEPAHDNVKNGKTLHIISDYKLIHYLFIYMFLSL